MLAQIPIDLPDDHELLAVATIALDAAGEYSLSIHNIVDASIRMTVHAGVAEASGLEFDAVAPFGIRANGPELLEPLPQ